MRNLVQEALGQSLLFAGRGQHTGPYQEMLFVKSGKIVQVIDEVMYNYHLGNSAKYSHQALGSE